MSALQNMWCFIVWAIETHLSHQGN